MIAESAAKKAKTFSSLPGANPDITPNIGTSMAPISINDAPCFTPLRRGEIVFSP